MVFDLCGYKQCVVNELSVVLDRDLRQHSHNTPYSAIETRQQLELLYWQHASNIILRYPNLGGPWRGTARYPAIHEKHKAIDYSDSTAQLANTNGRATKCSLSCLRAQVPETSHTKVSEVSQMGHMKQKWEHHPDKSQAMPPQRLQLETKK